MERRALEDGEEELGAILAPPSFFFCSLLSNGSNLQDRNNIFFQISPKRLIIKIISALLRNRKLNGADFRPLSPHRSKPLASCRAGRHADKGGEKLPRWCSCPLPNSALRPEGRPVWVVHPGPPRGRMHV